MSSVINSNAYLICFCGYTAVPFRNSFAKASNFCKTYVKVMCLKVEYRHKKMKFKLKKAKYNICIVIYLR